jgi:hypothetical protein
MLINGSLVADMKGIKEIKRKRLEEHWEIIPEQNKRDTTLKKKRKRFDIKVFKIKKAIGKKKQKNQQAVLLGQRSI